MRTAKLQTVIDAGGLCPADPDERRTRGTHSLELMILQRVAYQVFEHEAAGPWATDRTDWHQMDGEVVLTFNDGKKVFLSWGAGPQQYSIEQKDHSFFNVGVLVEVEMTEHSYWRPLIEQEIEIRYVDDEHQVLALERNEQSIFISSQYDDGTFYGDCVRVSQASPL